MSTTTTTPPTKMTIHRGLSELKIIDSKIAKAIDEIEPVGIHHLNKPINGLIEPEKFKSNAEGAYNKINDLIVRKGKIKSAIVTANGVTKVKIGEKEMTIADAINFKKSLEHKKYLVSVLKLKHDKVLSKYNLENEKVKASCDRVVEQAVGKDNVKIDPKDVEAISLPYMERNAVLFFNPLDLKDKVTTIENEIMDFESEVDAVLSEINSTTHIEIN